MTAHDKINMALLSRNMLPLDGYCSCASCGLTGLDRKQMHNVTYCKICIEDAEEYRAASLNTTYTDAETLTYDYARQEKVRR